MSKIKKQIQKILKTQTISPELKIAFFKAFIAYVKQKKLVKG